MSNCPLAEAASDAPNYIAIYTKEQLITFKELDQYAEKISREIPEGACLQIPGEPSIKFIATLFAAWKKNASVFPINPKIPSIPTIQNAPLRSLLIRTSGSTGSPKIAVLPLEQLIYNALGALKALDLRPQDRWKLSLPLYHVGGIGIVIRSILARSIISLDDDPLITHLSYVPTQLYRSTPVYKKLKCLLLGGAPIHQIPSSLPIYTTYGLTEMCSIVALNGSVLPFRELQIDNSGEILVKGKCLFQKYIGESPQQGWFKTKDLGKIANGKLEILGRKDWMFISGGENIQPEEIERHLLKIPGVLEAVVIGKNDPEFGKRPVAIIQSSKKFTFEQMRSFLSDFLPKYKIPIDLHFFEEIPRKSNFKINRFILEQFVNKQ